MSLPRHVAPEILDHLPPHDPIVLRVRRDLNLINSLMRNDSAMARALVQHFSGQAPRMLVDIGAGDGAFMLRVARRLAPRWQGVTVVLLDRQGLVDGATREAFAALKWNVETVAADVFDFLEQTKPSGVEIMTANLFLHHFEQPQLVRLFGLAARSASLFVACEPRRSRITVRLSPLLWLAGCDDVTCHDAVASAWAGFRGGELSEIWPARDEWRLDEQTVWPFSQCFVARRRG